ncbi:hypothetical protein AALO_G00088450 [Alosa alosa]|uniref:Saposin B-type domain-containing protein n=1 Tax=Alosa alosa TaxID=278164 RepID=A0AAV6H319_9TELE|nr:hypothetical protein AALO_G00088450 [Alosa alosa]
MIWICLNWISFMCLFHLSMGQARGVDQSLYCESCVETAKEIENVMGKATSSDRLSVIEHVVRGNLCQKHKRKDMKTSCIHLFEIHHEKFRTEMLTGNSQHLEIRLCYELSLACVGVKRLSQADKRTFEEDDIRTLLHANKDRVRTTRPLAEMNQKDEL